MIPSPRLSLIRDANGRSVALCDVNDLPPNVGAHIRRTLRRAQRSTPGAMVVRLGLFAVLPTIALHVFRFFNGQPISFGGIVFVLLGLGLAVVVVSIALSAGFSQRVQRAADALTSRGVCAACGYDMRDVVKDAARRFECAECGAAWQMRSP